MTQSGKHKASAAGESFGVSVVDKNMPPRLQCRPKGPKDSYGDSLGKASFWEFHQDYCIIKAPWTYILKFLDRAHVEIRIMRQPR